MPDDDRIVAVGLLTKRDLTLVGPHFARLYLVPPDAGFADLLKAIDLADDRRCVEKPGSESQMPFDPLDYQPSPPPSDPSPRRLTRRSEAVLLYVVFGLAFLLMLLPITPSGFADLVAYLRR